jgi:hypothetical protein
MGHIHEDFGPFSLETSDESVTIHAGYGWRPNRPRSVFGWHVWVTRRWGHFGIGIRRRHPVRAIAINFDWNLG